MTIRRNWAKEKPDRAPLKAASRRSSTTIRSLTWMLLGPILALLALSHGFGYDWRIPSGLRPQMWSKVDYDSKLTDPFFTSDEWFCPRGYSYGIICRDGKPALILNDPRTSWLAWLRGLRDLVEDISDFPEWTCSDGCKECATCRDGRPVKKSTARCYSTHSNVKHAVEFCEARLLDGNTIDLLIYHHSPAFDDGLRIRSRHGRFTCQYWHIRSVGARTWTTKRQKLTLDKKTYRKGDVIKGWIDFECVGEFVGRTAKRWGRRPTTIRVYGVFKTILE